MERRDADGIPSIVVGEFYANGRPRELDSPVVRVRRDGDVITRVALVPYGDDVECTYNRWVDARPSLEGQYAIHLTRTDPNFGGSRLWFHCVERSCARRSYRLFLVDLYFVCGRCARVRYPSQRRPKPRHVQQVERAKAIRTRLGGRPALFEPLPDRPKGMHHATYERLLEELREIERAEDARRHHEAVDRGEFSALEHFADLLKESLPKHSESGSASDVN